MVVAAASVMAISNNDNLRKGLAHLANISNVKISKKKRFRKTTRYRKCCRCDGSVSQEGDAVRDDIS